jgi:hypothetical protein
MGRDIGVQNIRLAKLSLPIALEIKIAKEYGLLKESYKAGDIIVWIGCGDIIELSEPLENNAIRVHYRQMWYPQDGKKQYEDYNGGSYTTIGPLLGAPDKYCNTYRLATKAEIKSREL